MSDRRNGLYYESMDIRNHVLSRNIGRYRGYKWSLLYNGGLAIGMPYAVETELVPYPLSDRSFDGLHLTAAFTKDANPKINVAWREGGLFGYTHEVINNSFDWISRNQNLLQSYFDYDSTEDLKMVLNEFPDSYPWNDSLRAYSLYSQPQNAEHFTDYPTYIRSIFDTVGPSFEKHLGENYIGRLMNMGFNPENIDENVGKFIDDVAGDITLDVEALKGIDDTKMGYLGRILLGEAKNHQINSVTHDHIGITPTLDFYYGLSEEALPNLMSGKLGGRGISYDFDLQGSVLGDRKFMVELDDDELEDGVDLTSPQTLYLNAIHKRALESQKFYRNGYTASLLGDDIDPRYVDYSNEPESESSMVMNRVPSGGYSIDSDMQWYGKGEKIYEGHDFVGPIAKLEGDPNGQDIPETYVSASNGRTYTFHDERDEAGAENIERTFLTENGHYGNYQLYTNSAASDSLLSKTRKLFREHKIKTLVGRFHTSSDDPGATEIGLTQTATNAFYGLSHGRNLMKLKLDTPNDYTNPYCRVWTYHHQYSKMSDLIRPFTNEEGKFMTVNDLQAGFPGRPIIHDPSRGSFADKTVLNSNGMVNIAPTRKISDDDKKAVDAKKCMFSIENLAWKNVHNDDRNILDEGEIGPLGGRIMWFPPYNLSFNESVSVSWGSNDFIGRGERIYSYTNTERTGSLSFTIVADHPSILDYWMNSDNRRNDTLNREEDQQKVLRFFAGCDILEVDGNTLRNAQAIDSEEIDVSMSNNNIPKDQQDKTVVDENNNVEEKRTTTPPDEFTKDNSIGFYVFFPNNLSCIDFVKNPKVGVNYLVNGINGFTFNPKIEGDKNWTVDVDGSGTQVLDADLAIIGDWAKDIEIDTPGKPGYEMNPNGYSQDSGLTDSYTTGEVKTHNENSANDKAHNYLWGYGVDTDKKKEKLCGPHGVYGDKSYKIYYQNYCDTTNYKLNAEPNKYDDACAYSFMDVAAAITTDYKYSGKGEDSERVQKIREILQLDKVKNSDTSRKYYFAIAGGASVHGYVDRNTGLSERRASFLRAWLEDCFKKLNLQVDYNESAKIPTKTGIEGGEHDLDVNSESAKRGRYAKAVIFWNDEDVKDATDANTAVEDMPAEAPDVTTIQETVIEDSQEANEDTAGESTTLHETANITNAGATRYRDEKEFFDRLEENSPVIYKNIVDKVKYFDPVYHAITPEGFNSRLSFLHQCTRQGPTMSSSDLSLNNGLTGAGYAGNLSFGRAPVCVLRLGDFFYTRIIINSLNIQYETAQWDLNPEGIGVQPMFANVTISFVFQGGSSLGGPIQRLQNAVSFNYYANQEVYDDRADVAVYKNRELDQDSTLVWLPGYGNMNVGDVQKIMNKKATVQAPINQTVNENIAESKALAAAENQEQQKPDAMEIIANASD